MIAPPQRRSPMQMGTGFPLRGSNDAWLAICSGQSAAGVGHGTQVVLHLQQGGQFLVSLHHVSDRNVGVVSDLLGRGQDDELARRPPVQHQRRQHDAGGNGRLAVLFANVNTMRISNESCLLAFTLPADTPRNTPLSELMHLVALSYSGAIYHASR